MAAAHATPPVNPSTIVATSGQDFTGLVNGNVDVPSGISASFDWAHVTGNVTVEGTLAVHASQIDGNVSVNHGIFAVGNDPASSIGGNLSIKNSPGSSVWSDPPANGFWDSGVTIGGGFSYTYNTGRLYVGNAAVNGTFTYAYNTGPAPDLGGLHVNGQRNVS